MEKLICFLTTALSLTRVSIYSNSKVCCVVELLCILILEYIQSSCNVLSPPANNMHVKETHLKEEEILVTMSCHGDVHCSVSTVHSVSTQFPAFLGLPALPLAAVLSWQGEEAANGRGHRVQYVRHTQIVCHEPMGTIKADKCSSSVKLTLIAIMVR